jgi:DnaK suppressor protein
VTSRQLRQLRSRLVARMVQLLRAVRTDLHESAIRSVFEAEEGPQDEADESSRDQVRDLRLSLAENDARLAQSIEAALERMDAGEYGVCAECGDSIDYERLKVVPWAIRHTDCQEIVEETVRHRPPTL